MTLESWLHARVPAPPAALASRIRELVDAVPRAPGAPHADVLLDAGQTLLRQLLGADRTSRHGAIDLLAADALVTYAFEAAASDPDRIGSRADAAMQLLAALATGEPS